MTAPHIGFTPPHSARAHHKQARWHGYAALQWRLDADPAAPSAAPAAHYGGSQWAVQISRDLGPASHPDRVQLYARPSAPIGARTGREVALGVSARPVATLPLRLHAERRLCPDTADTTALYVSGGVEAALPHALKLSAYGAAGYSHGGADTPFADGAVRIDRPLVKAQSLQMNAGIGAWAGGQKGAHRIDIGPGVRMDIRMPPAIVRIDADWRLRVGGNAAPQQGPVLTLSGSF